MVAVLAAYGVEHPWRTLDFLDVGEGSIALREQQLVIVVEARPPVVVPAGDVAVVLVRDSVSVSGAALAALSARGTALLVCDWRNVPIGATSPWREHSRIGARVRAQVDCSRPRNKQVWAELVRAKISGQAWVLRSMVGDQSGWQDVRSLAEQVRSGDPDNREGVAAAAYWKRFQPNFIRDRTSGDSFNAALNYGYTVLRGHAIRAAAQAGLCLSIGVFHRGPTNQFALADDLIEPFRPAVGTTVLSLAADGFLGISDPECRRRLVAAGSAPMRGDDGPTVAGQMVLTAQRLGMFFEQSGDEAFTSPSWRGSPPCG